MNIFDCKTYKFFENEMCMDISVYEDRIEKYSKNEFIFFRKLGQYLVKSNINNPNFIDDTKKLQKKYNIEADESIETAHVLSYAVKFFREKGGGLLVSYIFTESENWQPLPKIKKSLYDEMDVVDKETYEGLPNQIKIYRGTSIDEYTSGHFGQSWTLDKTQANHFAFDLNQEKCNDKERVILSAIIDKKDIYAYSSHNQEALCIINPKKITPSLSPTS